MGFLSGVAASVAKWLLEKLGAYLFDVWRKWSRDKKIDDNVEKEIKAVEAMVEEAKKSIENIEQQAVLAEGEQRVRLSKEQEDRLRQATRRLKSGFFG